MAKNITCWAEWKRDFHRKRDELRVFLKRNRTEDIREAFPEWAKDEEGIERPRGQMITKILNDFTRAFYEELDKISKEVADRENKKIENQILQFHS